MARARLAKALIARNVQSGAVLMCKAATPSRYVCFIASGAVKAETAGQKHRLGRGEMFGELSLLSRQTRRTQVTAISHSTLLVLDEARFRRMPDRNQTLRTAVLESTKTRGIGVSALKITAQEQSTDPPLGQAKLSPATTPPSSRPSPTHQIHLRRRCDAMTASAHCCRCAAARASICFPPHCVDLATNAVNGCGHSANDPKVRSAALIAAKTLRLG